ncbi:helix-hairpin-helix domain-containing protein [Myxococcota bacterium]|nr:helix-hairpin-helix domain-containing protein [Myxococcota bacterium]
MRGSNGRGRPAPTLSSPVGRADAALALAGLLCLLGLPDRMGPSAVCADPTEVEAANSRSVAVRCGQGATQELRGPARLLFDLPVDLNHADSVTLEALPGIGASRARAILTERARKPFENRLDLQRVRGIGARTVEELRGWVGVDRG